MRRLSVFITVISLVVSAAMFLVLTVIIYHWSDHIAIQQAEIASHELVLDFRNCIENFMLSGASYKQIAKMDKAMRHDRYKNQEFNTRLYSMVREGHPEQKHNIKSADHAIREVQLTGKKLLQRNHDKLRLLYPIKAKKRCISCHSSWRVGGVVAVYEVKHDMGPHLAQGRIWMILFLATLFPIPLLGALLISRVIARRINRAIKTLNECAVKVSRTGDFTATDLRFNQNGFQEFDKLADQVGMLAQTIKGTTQNLRTQVQALESMIITEESILNWQAEAVRIVSGMGRETPILAFLAAFSLPGRGREIVVFWTDNPSLRAKEQLVSLMMEELQWGRPNDVEQVVNIVHHVAVRDSQLLDQEPEALRAATELMSFGTSRVGHVVGGGILADASAGCPVLVLRSILGSTLNVVGALRAIDEYARQIEFNATRDSMTNLYNQKMFWDLLNYEIKRSQRHGYKSSVLVLDLDGFKLVNDAYGHVFGDELLKEIADLIRKNARTEDLVARYGGDEFVIIASGADAEQGYLIGKRLLEAFAGFTMKTPNGNPLCISASIGIAVFPDHAGNSKDLFKVADEMMYRAKAEGKGRVNLPAAADLVDLAVVTGETSRILSLALAEDRFIPYFQPIVDTRDMSIIGHEVLLRVELPDRVVPAGELIETAELMGLINQIDLMVFEKAFARISEQKYKGLIFLNFSPSAIICKDFMTDVRKLTNRYGIPPVQIIMEITERQTVRNITLLESFVKDLVKDGFGFAVDDFGSGFSSFQYMRRFKVGTVKIDGQFAQKILDKDGFDRAVVVSIATLARVLGIRALAEFVESEEILKEVVACGVEYAQGYYIGRPAPDLHKQS